MAGEHRFYGWGITQAHTHILSEITDLVADLADLTAAEVQQLENIDSVTISAAQWGYLGDMDQGVASDQSVTFASLTTTGDVAVAGGEVNIGANAPSDDWDPTYDLVELGGNATLAALAAAGANGEVVLAQNCYYDDTDKRWEYQDADEASRYVQADGIHTFVCSSSGAADGATGDTTVMNIAGSYVQLLQRLRIGTNAPQESWDTATFDTVALGGNAHLAAHRSAGASGDFHMCQNAYYDSGDSRWEYQDADQATLYTQHDGKHVFYVAVAGAAGDDPITWIVSFDITNDGDLYFYKSLVMSTGEYIGIGDAAGRLVFVDGAPDTITVTAAEFRAAAGCSIDCYTNAGYLKSRRVTQAAQPTPQTGELLVHHDTDDGKTYIVYEDPTVGTRQVEMT